MAQYLNVEKKDFWMSWVRKNRKKYNKIFVEKRKEIRKLRKEKRLSKLEDKK